MHSIVHSAHLPANIYLKIRYEFGEIVPHEATFTYFQESPQKVSRNDMSQILEVLFI